MAARKRRKRSAHRNAIARRERPCGPTPQTVAKLKRDLILHLYEKGRLGTEHLQAAEEIRRIWQAFSRSLGPTAVDPNTLATGRRTAPGRQPVEWLTAAEEHIWRKRYRPWAREMSVASCGGTIRVTPFQLVLDIVVDNRSLRRVEGAYRIRHGDAAGHLEAALTRYVEIAGWSRQTF